MTRNMSWLLTGLLVVLLAASAQAQYTDNLWLPAGEGNWFEAGNWKWGVPLAGHNVRIAQGTAQVTDSQQQADCYRLAVGHSSTDPLGGLIISNGSRLVARDEASIGWFSGSRGGVTVSGGDSLLHVYSDLMVGHYGSGSLRVESGGKVISNHGYINRSDYCGDSSVTVSGQGSRWEMRDFLSLGGKQLSALRIEAGGVVDTKYLYTNGQNVSIVVSGKDSKLLAEQSDYEAFKMNSPVQASLRVEAGAELRTKRSVIGEYNYGDNSVVVSGKGSSWTCWGLTVGYQGRGSVRVESGATLNSRSGSIGDGGPGSSVVVSGLGSTWNASQGIAVGGEGKGLLRIESGGMVAAPSCTVGWHEYNTARAVVTGSQSLLAVGNLNVYRKGEFTVSNAAEVRVSGTLNAAIDSIFTLEDGWVTATTVTQHASGQAHWLGGTAVIGSYQGNWNCAGSRIESLPDRYGVNITGNLVLGSEATLLIDVDGAADGSQFDCLTVQNAASLAGTLVLDFNDYLPTRRMTYQFLSAGSIAGTFDEYQVIGLDPALVSYDVGAGTFTVIPEPATVALLAAGLAALAARRRSGGGRG